MSGEVLSTLAAYSAGRRDHRRGELRVYLGAAPGVGKTFAMLGEGRRRRDRGADVVVAFVQTHGRPRTAEQIGDLEVVPRRHLEYRGADFEEMDVDAILARRPEVALVDELAHTNVPGSRNTKRWQDVEELLTAGITVISTVNIQHLESLNDVVEGITGIKQRETIPDDVVRSADQVELVDMVPEALRRRMAHGNIYAVDKIDAALANYFRVGNLTALRELALLWVADQVDTALDDYRERHGITQPWETRERVIVAITGAPESEQLIRRAARIAQRTHGELFGVHIRTDTGLADQGSSGRITAYRRLLEEVGGEYREVTGGDVAAALIDVARAENATQVVLGASRRSRWQELTQGSVINRAITLAQANDLRAALLQAVSHDLRTPLAAIKASISSIRQPDMDWPPEQIDEFHATIEDETDRLDSLVANLLDMSRIQAGALRVAIRPVGLEEVVPAAVAGLGTRSHQVVVDTPESLPPAAADPALLERALANLIDNALSAAPPDKPVRIEAGAVAGRVDTRIIDQGAGIPRQDRELVFQPFQRLDDHGSGVGLGLAIARGFVEAMGGELALEDTPGGGVTMVVSLPEAR